MRYTKEQLLKYAELYRFSSSRISFEQFDEMIKEQSPSDFNELQSTKEPQLHLSANDGETENEATQMVFHKMADGTLFCEVYPHESKKKIYSHDQFTFDEAAKTRLKEFLNNGKTY